MIHPNSIPEMEAALAARGVSVAELCRQAAIAETTWGRWKRKEVNPRMDTWDTVVSAYKVIIGKKKGAAQ